MRRLTKFLLTSIVQRPEEVKVGKREEGDLITLDVEVSEDDIGKVIGKNGKIVKALTTLIRIKAVKKGKIVALNLVPSKND